MPSGLGSGEEGQLEALYLQIGQALQELGKCDDDVRNGAVAFVSL